MTDPTQVDELAALIEQSDFAEECAELVIEAGWMHPDDAERLATIGMNNCDSALDWKERAEAAEAKVARVEALAANPYYAQVLVGGEAETTDGTPLVFVGDLRAALAEQTRIADGDDEPPALEAS